MICNCNIQIISRFSKYWLLISKNFDFQNLMEYSKEVNITCLLSWNKLQKFIFNQSIIWNTKVSNWIFKYIKFSNTFQKLTKRILFQSINKYSKTFLKKYFISSILQCSGHAVRCFPGGPRKSNESQCPMLQRNDKPQAAPQPATSNNSQSSSSKKSSTPTSKNHLSNACSVQNSPHQKKLRCQLAKERKASTTLGIIMSTFTICWLPFFVLALVRPFLRDPRSIPSSLSSIFLWLGYFNSLLNPIIYATLNRDFRKPFREILFFRCSNLNHIMREEFYQSQYGNPENNYGVIRAHDASDECNRVVPQSSHHEIDDGLESTVQVALNPPNESFLWICVFGFRGVHLFLLRLSYFLDFLGFEMILKKNFDIWKMGKMSFRKIMILIVFFWVRI